MADIPEELKIPLSLAGLPTSMEEFKEWIKDPKNVETANTFLDKAPEDIKSKIPPELMQILNNPSPEKKSSDTTGDIGAPELNPDNKANIKKIFQDIEKSIYNNVIMDKTDYKNKVENKFLFKLTPKSGTNKRPDIHNYKFYHETQTQSDTPIFDINAFWVPFINDMFYPPDNDSYKSMDKFFLDIIDLVVQKINLSLKDQPYRIIYYKNDEIPSSLNDNFKQNTNNIALKSIPNQEDANKILQEKLKETAKEI